MDKAPGVVRIATVNVNGIRAAMRKGMYGWLTERELDIVALQEVRASDEIVQELFVDTGWHIVSAASKVKGHAGVAILSRISPEQIRIGIPTDDYFDDRGRWLEIQVNINSVPLKFVSAYFPSGEVGTPKQEEKYRYLDAAEKYLRQLKTEKIQTLILGDINVAHTELDIKNWKGNLKKSGFLPEERVYLDKFFGDLDFKDIARELTGGIDKARAEGITGPYTWWSPRGQAFDNNTGWRIDYQIATPELAKKALTAVVDRAPSYEARWSDHAPLVVDYKMQHNSDV